MGPERQRSRPKGEVGSIPGSSRLRRRGHGIENPAAVRAAAGGANEKLSGRSTNGEN